jgi:hypothetical protein
MATIIFAWQLGGGMGHLMQMLPLARGLSARGHAVFVAVKDLARAAALYGDAGVRFLQAPVVNRERPRRFPAPVSLAHVMGNTDFGHRVDLHGGAAAWRNLFRLARPDLIVFDHAPLAPLALLAARGGVGARRAVIGTGFFCPPDVRPLPVVRCRRDLDAHPGLADPARLLADEDAVLANANWMLGQWKAPPLERLGQLYGDVDECFLTTFRELDHCPDRPAGARFRGPVNGSGGDVPEWPGGRGKRVFAYLKPYRGIEHLLAALRDRGCPTVVYSDSIGRELRGRFEGATLRFAAGPSRGRGNSLFINNRFARDICIAECRA